jgi:threonine aldolase
VFHYECGAGGAFAGVQFLPVGRGGLFTAEDVAGAIKPDHYYLAPTRLVAVENTHNVSGGRIFPQEEIDRIAALARDRGLALHLDGARLWNAAVATGKTLAELAAPFDTVSVCFSKGLGAPAGSALVGPAALIDVRARRLRRMFGGAMRQVGFLCAAAAHALDNHRERLVEDHENAGHLAAGLSALEGISCDPDAVETNIVSFEVEAGDAAAFARRAADAGVLVGALDDRRVRAVTHLDVSRAEVERAVEGLAGAIG